MVTMWSAGLVFYARDKSQIRLDWCYVKCLHKHTDCWSLNIKNIGCVTFLQDTLCLLSLLSDSMRALTWLGNPRVTWSLPLPLYFQFTETVLLAGFSHADSKRVFHPNPRGKQKGQELFKSWWNLDFFCLCVKIKLPRTVEVRRSLLHMKQCRFVF